MDFILQSFNSSIAAAALLLVFFSSYSLVKKGRAAANEHKKAPEASGAWPIIGHLPHLAGPQLLHKTLGAMAAKYGPIFTVHLGVHPTLVVSSVEIAKELFTTNDHAVSSRPPFVAAKHLGYNFAMFGLAPHGSYWREMRKITTLELLSSRRLELLKHMRAHEVEISLKVLYKQWTEKKNGLGLVTIDLQQWFGDLTLNVILRMIAGKRIEASIVGDDKEARRWGKAMREFFHYLGLFVAGDAVPFLGWLDVGGHEKAMKRTAKELNGILEEWLEEHKRNRALSEDKRELDFMDVMLSILDGKNLGGYDADTVNKATCLAMIAGGNDTSMVTITWALSLLLNNRQALAKVQEELDRCVGKERLVNDADISKLVYLQAMVKETLRLYPAAPLLPPRQFIDDCTIAGYHIPKNTRLIVNLWKMQRDSRHWPNPLEFLPERFLTTHKEVDVKGHNFELIPFGSGRRICPGINFAMQLVHLTLATFLHAFEISTPNNAPVDMIESTGLTNFNAAPLRVLVSPRLSAHLYEY